ncbi:glycosyltransferase family 39 protein, partial [Candidatus Fermentibacteria bacterium]|nr:glycosyltransferase family 39 protein [Candidatus Fermentibacteria bacterium]
MGSERARVHAPGTAGGNLPPHNNRIASALKTAWPGLAILGYFGIAIAFCDPLHDTALYDDWAYADNVRRFVERGELRFVWTQVPFFGQLLGGALFAVLFGFSFASLHLFGLTMGVMGTFAVYALVREFGRSRSTSLLLALAVASTTAYFHFCFTFMTDVPATASFLVFLAVFARAERAASRGEPHTVRLFLIAGIILAISATIRDFTLFFLVSPILAWPMTRQRHTRLAAVASTVALSIFSYGIMHVFVEMPLRKAKLAPVFFQPESLRQAYVMTSYLGLALVPLVLALVPDFVRREVRGSWRRWLLWGACLVLVSGLAAYQYGHAMTNEPDERNELMPYRPGFISIFGIYNRLTIPGTPVVIMPPAVRYALTGLAILGASVLLYAGMVLLQVLVARGRREARLRGVTAWCAAAAGALGLLLWWLGPRRIHDSGAIMGSPRVIGEALVLLCALSALVFAAMLR